jgi:hypothetical protein
LELLIRANLSTAGAARYCDKMSCYMKDNLKRNSVTPYYDKPLKFLVHEQFEKKKKDMQEYLSARRSPNGISLERISSMLSLDDRCVLFFIS